MNILMNGEDPVGGKWSFDGDNRKKLPKGIKVPSFPKINQTVHTKKLKNIIETKFSTHPGSTENFWFATEYKDCLLYTSPSPRDVRSSRMPSSA